MDGGSKRETYAVGEWIVATMVVSDVHSFFTTDITSFAVKLSKPLVGSSRNSTEGSVISAMAMFRRLLCPPDRPFTIGLPTRTSRASHKPRSASSWSTALSLLCRLSCIGRLSSAVYRSISRAVSAAMSVSNCST